MAIKNIRTIETGIIPYDVKINHLIEKAKEKGKINTISTPPIKIKG